MICTFQFQLKSNDIVFQCDEDGEILRSFLESELQEDLVHTSKLLARCKSPNILDFEITGNAYTLLINRQKFKIENQFDETEQLAGKRDKLIDILENWEALLRGKSKL
ncbi:MAG: hypothetical protein V7727_17585 [Sneathiella sp.]